MISKTIIFLLTATCIFASPTEIVNIAAKGIESKVRSTEIKAVSDFLKTTFKYTEHSEVEPQEVGFQKGISVLSTLKIIKQNIEQSKNKTIRFYTEDTSEKNSQTITTWICTPLLKRNGYKQYVIEFQFEDRKLNRVLLADNGVYLGLSDELIKKLDHIDMLIKKQLIEQGAALNCNVGGSRADDSPN